MAFGPETSGKTVFESIWGPPQGQFLETKFGTTHYKLESPTDTITTTPLVVLQHGIGGNLKVWDKIAADLVSKGSRVLRYDFYDRGYSESDPIKYPIKTVGTHPLDFTLDLYVEQLEEVLEKLDLGKESIIHCGHSNGGVVGIGFTAKHPDQVRGLVLVDAVCLPVKKPLAAYVADVPLVGNFIVKSMGAKTFNKFSYASCADPDNNGEVATFLENQSRNALENPRFFAAVRSTNKHCLGFRGTAEPLFRQCCSAKVPIHLVWGKADTSVPYSDCVKLHEIAKEIGPTLVTEDSFDDMPHNVFFADAKPEECSDSICAFVEKVHAN